MCSAIRYCSFINQLILVALLSACSLVTPSSSDPEVLTFPTDALVPTKNLETSEAVLPTATNTVVSPTVIPTSMAFATPTFTPAPSMTPVLAPPNMMFQKLCDSEFSQLGNMAIQSGTLLFHTLEQVDIWQATQGTISEAHTIPSPSFLDYRLSGSFSPNNASLVITNKAVSPATFEVFSMDDNPPQMFLWQDNWPNVEEHTMHWFDNDSLQIYTNDGYFLISALTGEVEQIFSYPDLPDGEIILADHPTHLVYLNQKSHVVIHDIYNQEDIYESEISLGNQLAIAWSPDGTSLLFWGNTGELYLVDLTGNEEQITDFSSLLDLLWVQSIYWSPNQRYIALLVTAKFPDEPQQDRGLRLFVFDRELRTLNDYCSVDYDNRFAVLDWSPDSKQLLISHRPELPDIILDVATGEVTQLPEDIKVIAWKP